MTIHGACICGAVSYKIEGKLRDAASCHCSMCRKTYGSQASAYALLDPDDFSWLTGENLLTDVGPTNGQGRQFCIKCGSTLCGTHNGKVGWVSLGCV